MSAALKGFKVLELAGVGPAPLCGLMLQDFGAFVIRINNPKAMFTDSFLSLTKHQFAIDLKKDIKQLKDLCVNNDVLLDPYRPGTLEKLGIGPTELHKLNKKLIITRISGYGQSFNSTGSDLSEFPGHDINYLAESGLLWYCTGANADFPSPPGNLIADYAGGAIMGAFGTTLALLEREKTGKGQVVDCSIVSGLTYLASFAYVTRQLSNIVNNDETVQDNDALTTTIVKNIWPSLHERCKNLFDGGAHFYRVYQTQDNRHVAVGALEPHFYAALLKLLGLSAAEAPQFPRLRWPELTNRFAELFAARPFSHWTEQASPAETRLRGQACITPVWSPEEVLQRRPERFRPMPVALQTAVAQGDTDASQQVVLQAPKPCPVFY